MADYITIRDRQYRVEVSMGALEAFLEAVGVDDLRQADFKKPKNQLILMALCIVAGEEMDGRECDDIVTTMQALHLGEFRDAFDAFAKIYARQSDPHTGAQEAKKK